MTFWGDTDPWWGRDSPCCMGVGGEGSITGLPGMQRFSPPAPSPGYLPARRRRGADRRSASGRLIPFGAQPDRYISWLSPGWPRPSPGRRTPRGLLRVQVSRRTVRHARRSQVRRRGCGPGRPGVVRRSAEGGGPDPQLDRQDFAGAYTQCNTRVTCSRMGRPEGMEDAKSVPVRRSEPAARGSGIGLRGGPAAA